MCSVDKMIERIARNIEEVHLPKFPLPLPEFQEAIWRNNPFPLAVRFAIGQASHIKQLVLV